MAFYFLLQTIAVLWAVASQVHGNNAFQNNYQFNQQEGCDFSQGSWVIDYPYYPLYDPSIHCPFIVQGFDCLRNGRPDQDYLKYRWKPSNCDLPRLFFNFRLLFLLFLLFYISQYNDIFV